MPNSSAAEVRGTPAATDNWGGSSINDHHSFIVIYRPEDDKHLDMHIDACDVTSPEASWIQSVRRAGRASINWTQRATAE